MRNRLWSDWGEAYHHYLSKGYDNGAAAFAADEYMKYRGRIERAQRN